MTNAHQIELPFDQVGYIVTVTLEKGITLDDLSDEDRTTLPLGSHHYDVENEEMALTEFHETIPIAVLDDFNITCAPHFPGK